MASRLLRGAGLFVVFWVTSMVACGGVPARGPSGPTLPPEEYMPSGATWVGRWDTSFGPLDIIGMNRASGYDFAGEYQRESDGLVVSGYFTANAENNTMRITWTERRSGEHKSGKAIWRMSPDGTSFAGMWGKGNSATDGGRWEGRKAD
jgi:hypothetical protein